MIKSSNNNHIIHKILRRFYKFYECIAVKEYVHVIFFFDKDMYMSLPVVFDFNRLKKLKRFLVKKAYNLLFSQIQ